MKITTGFFVIFIAMNFISCVHRKDQPSIQGVHPLYTCPMPEDSFFSDTPGQCPKCGMDLVQTTAHEQEGHGSVYICPMHAEIEKYEPGNCPVCGMPLVEKSSPNPDVPGPGLYALLKPTNQFIISSIKDTSIQTTEIALETEAPGVIDYDTREIYRISSNVEGRIEKLYIRYRYQKIHEGQRIMDLYSPELVTAQQNLLFLLGQTPENNNLIRAAKEKLILLGMDTSQLLELIKTGTPLLAVSVFSKRSGHIIESSNMEVLSGQMARNEGTDEQLSLKEGMYVRKGQPLLSVYDPKRAWAILHIPGESLSWVKKGNPAEIRSESAPQVAIRGKIDFIEPYYQEDSKTLTARVYFNNRVNNLPIGSPVKAKITGHSKISQWLPKTAVLSSGFQKVVFLKTEEGFKAILVRTGMVYEDLVEILGGLTLHDRVAANAQYLLDSESFITVKN